jgi:hypothetical protein
MAILEFKFRGTYRYQNVANNYLSVKARDQEGNINVVGFLVKKRNSYSSL